MEQLPPYIGAIDNTGIYFITDLDGSIPPSLDKPLIPLIPKSIMAEYITPEITVFLVICDNILTDEQVIAEYTLCDQKIDMTIWPIECFENLYNIFEKFIVKQCKNTFYPEVEFSKIN